MILPDGYTDVPPGKLAAVVTALEMFEQPPLRAEQPSTALTLTRIADPDPAWFRGLFRKTGEDWLWFSRLLLSEEKLGAIICDPAVEVHVLRSDADEAGLLELDFRTPEECELSFFGLTPAFVGGGAGRWLMNRAIERVWSQPIRRFWVHTCSLDHPAALPFYVRSGFKPFRRQIELFDDPRLTGVLPRTAAPQVPIIEA